MSKEFVYNNWSDFSSEGINYQIPQLNKEEWQKNFEAIKKLDFKNKQETRIDFIFDEIYSILNSKNPKKEDLEKWISLVVEWLEKLKIMDFLKKEKKLEIEIWLKAAGFFLKKALEKKRIKDKLESLKIKK